jgi:hypothetical protein
MMKSWWVTHLFRKFGFVVLVLFALAYSAKELAVTEVRAQCNGAPCCEFQVDCGPTKHCETIYPNCSSACIHICRDGPPEEN